MPTELIAAISSSPTFRSAIRRCCENGTTVRLVSAVKNVIAGASRNIHWFASRGTMSSFSSIFTASAIVCSSPCGPTRIGPSRTCRSASTFRSISTM
jgi:hypothetical protein